MEKLTEQEIIERIMAGEPVAATVDSGAFRICIARYTPLVVTAIHDGHTVSEALAEQMLVTGEQRLFEEDPFTGVIAEHHPISLVVSHSRYLYDLNRRPESCIYHEAWGRQVWRREPDKHQTAVLLGLHRSYYRVLDALIGVLEKRFRACVVYDLHSYNHSRISGNPPLFNIGTHFIEMSVFRPAVERLALLLASLQVPGVDNRAACDEVFFGKGYQAQYLRGTHPDSLCLPIEIKKVFMDEETFALDQQKFAALEQGMAAALAEHGSWFVRQYCR